MLDRTGEVLDGRYTLVRLIGEGGMGQVYEGRHLVTGRKVAVKFLLEELAQNAEAVGRFYREARAATAIGSEHICQVLDMRPPEQGPPYLVMEYLEGETLADRLAREACLSIPASLEVVLQACDALQAAHDAGIVHRDIKPENIFLVPREGRPPLVKLLDFGISKFQKRTDDNLSLTRTGTVLGTPYYMSPEQARGDRAIGPLSDLYSLGVIFYECVAGEVPFDAEAFSALVVKIVSATPEHPSDIRTDLPRDLGDVVLRAFAREEDDRFQSAAELAAAIRSWAGGNQVTLATVLVGSQASFAPRSSSAQGVSRQTGTPMVWEQEPAGPGRRTGLVVAVIVGVLLVGAGVGGAIWLLARGRTTTVPVVVVQPPLPQPAPPPPPLGGDAGGSADADSAAAPSRARVRLVATPPEARLTLDGDGLEGNPAEVELVADGSRHVLAASAEGFRPGEVVFLATADTEEVTLDLDRRRRGGGVTKRPPPPVEPPPATKRPPRPPSGGVPGVVDPWAD